MATLRSPVSRPKTQSFSASPGMRPGTRRHTNRILLGATLLTVALSFVPWAGYVTWPIRMMVTFIHEGWHALAALATGGEVHAIEVVPGGSGSTLTRGGIGVLISSAGYLGATFTGTALLASLRRGVHGNRLLAVLALAVGAVTVAALSSPFTLATGLGLTFVLALLALRLPRVPADIAAGFLGVQCALNAFYDLRTLFVLSVGSGAQTDAMNMQSATLVPAVFWALLWMAMGVGMVWKMLLRPMANGR